jgi:hypothetical protein
VNLAQKLTGTEQIVAIARGATGCLDGTLHSIMKYIAVALGKRYEHQRGDRDTYITMNNANVMSGVKYPKHGDLTALSIHRIILRTFDSMPTSSLLSPPAKLFGVCTPTISVPSPTTNRWSMQRLVPMRSLWSLGPCQATFLNSTNLVKLTAS